MTDSQHEAKSASRCSASLFAVTSGRPGFVKCRSPESITRLRVVGLPLGARKRPSERDRKHRRAGSCNGWQSGSKTAVPRRIPERGQPLTLEGQAGWSQVKHRSCQSAITQSVECGKSEKSAPPLAFAPVKSVNCRFHDMRHSLRFGAEKRRSTGDSTGWTVNWRDLSCW